MQNLTYIKDMERQGFHIGILAALLLSVSLNAPLWAAGLTLQKIDTADALKTLDNYDRGFYTPQVLHLKPSGNSPITKPSGKFLHLRAEISEFSSNAPISETTYGVSQDLTEDALNALQTTLDNIRANGGYTIVRICYDPWYNGKSNVTPDHKWVLRHVEQLAPVLSKNTDVILALEMGMHGAYGEMHSDTSITYERVSEAVNLMLKLTPPELKILTRTANYSAAVLGFENWGVDFHIDSEKFKQIASAKADTLYRVGMFNDGYLGTEYDYGTWGEDCASSICREEGVAWLEKYSIHTPYGGEALATANGFKTINTPEYLSYEGFRTHTSYLNSQWNYDLVTSWKNVKFHGKDFEYDSTVTGFKYIEDHLGYRFVLRESSVLDTIGDDGVFLAKVRIQNVGFGNLTHSASAKLIFVENLDDSMVESCPNTFYVDLPDVDFQNLLSRKLSIENGDTSMIFDGNNEMEFVVKTQLQNGNYHVFLNAGNISFANDKSKRYHCETEPLLYIGDVVVDESVKSGIPPYQKRSPSQKTMDSVVQRNRWNAIVHREDKFFRINGSVFKNP